MWREIDNPLDPGKVSDEMRTKPFVPRNMGVEAYDSGDLPIVLAYQEAMNRRGSDSPNCAVVIEFDITGLEQYPHWLAGALYNEVADQLLKEILDTEGTIEAIGARDTDALESLLYEVAERARDDTGGWDSGPPRSWIDEATKFVDPITPYGFSNVAEALSEMDPDQLLALLVEAGHSGELPLDLFTKAIRATTYLDPIDPSRVVRVMAYRPLRDELAEPESWDTDPDVDEEDGPQVFDVDSIFEGNVVPAGTLIWGRPDIGRGGPTQLVPTDMMGARVALPHLAERLSCPWSYTQES